MDELTPGQAIFRYIIINPIVYLRATGVLISIIVFGCLADKSYSDINDHCLINDSDACNLGVGVGVVAMLMCLAAYTKDFMYAFISNHQLRKILLIVDAAAFGTYGLLWFITFVYMAAEWGEVTDFERDNYVKQNGGDVDTIQAAITFSFFAILVWAAIAILNVIYYFYWVGWPCVQQGSMDYGSGYESIPGSSSHGGVPHNDDYQPPVY